MLHLDPAFVRKPNHSDPKNIINLSATKTKRRSNSIMETGAKLAGLTDKSRGSSRNKASTRYNSLDAYDEKMGKPNVTPYKLPKITSGELTA